ncbi:MAG: M20/M25/M40 family metallo-hydrolase [Alicyclobacillus sp.]|nr:M20/M25/M40 family metallo-hydrolase [Alicyclobacillus sp.]
MREAATSEFPSIEALFLELVQIPSHSLHEGAMAKRCRALLEQLGCTVQVDDAGAGLGGETGNVIARFPGDEAEDPVLLTAHMDTVPPGEGVRPVVDPDGTVHGDGTTVLGADDKAGVTAILAALNQLRMKGTPHPPVEVVLTIAEEMGLQGSRALDVQQLRSRTGLCLDAGGPVGSFVVAGPTQVRWNAEFVGRAAHAGVSPERGVSAIKMAAAAVAKMPHGRISPHTTVNIGSFVGEGPTNVVRDRVTLVGEARGLESNELADVLREIESGFRVTAERLGGQVSFHARTAYERFHFPADHPLRQRVAAAAEAVGFVPQAVHSGGGSDASIFTQRGIPTINLGVGYVDIHSTQERIQLADIERLTAWVVACLSRSPQASG